MAPSPPRSQAQLPPLIPPFRLCLVEDGVYRGAHPSLKNMRFMRRLKLGTILSLVPEPFGPSKDLRDYCGAEGIRHIWHHVPKYNDGFSHTPQLVASVLGELIDPRNHPILLHCRDGGHNTGLVIMCLRRLQNWSLPTIHEEFIRYTKSNEITFEEKQFVESFHAKVTVPLRIPSWLWEGVRHKKHPSIQLEFEIDPATPNSLKSPSTSNSRDLEQFAVLLPSKVGQHGNAAVRASRYVHVRAHYTIQRAALDVCGVHFVECCRPNIDGDIPRANGHNT